MTRRAGAAGLALAIGLSGCAEGGHGPDPDRDRTGPRQAAGCELRASRARTGDVPMAVDGVDARDVWVVGAHYVGGDGLPLAARWDGERWDATTVELDTGPDAGFHDVEAVSSDQVWAVGSVHASEPLLRRWDGSSWTDVTVPTIAAHEAELFGVGAADPRTAWAVGRALVGRTWRPLAMGWDGAGWRVVDVPAPRGDAALRGVAAASPREAWAVGWTVERGGRHRALALRFDGGTWRTTRVPEPGDGDQVLSAVAAAGPDEAWAVGWTIGADGRDLPLVLRWAGGRWGPVPIPPIDGRVVHLIDVATEADGEVWIAGSVVGEAGLHRPLVLLGSGGSWSVVPAPNPGALDDTLAGIALIGGAPWAAGTSVDDVGIYASLILSGC